MDLSPSVVLAQIQEAALPGWPADRPPALNERCGAFGEIPLHLCAVWGDPDACRALVEAGSEIDVPGEHGYTPLHEAATRGHSQIITLLLQHGANPALPTAFGSTAIQLAAGHPEALALLSASPGYRPLRPEELPTLLSWALAEGWNPGLSDADAFLAADPEGFHAMEHAGELIGAASTVVYDGCFGFVGLLIVKPEWRGHGFGRAFWRYFMARMKERIGAEGGAALDGVFTMQEKYAQSGFRFSHRNLRMEGIGAAAGELHPKLREVGELPQIAAYDRAHFGSSREAFLKRWLAMKGARTLAFVDDNRLLGYGVIRPCHRGAKIGPLFADTPAIAEALFRGLSAYAANAPLFLDIPENNPAAIALAERHGMREVFGCARMTLGQAPKLPWSEIYGVTTFELG